MKYLACAFFLVLAPGIFGSAKLTYKYDEVTYSVDGFDLARPFSIVDGTKKYLPLDGMWGLEILNDSFWDNCHFPKTYELSRDIVSYKDSDASGRYLIRLERDEFPRQFLHSEESPLSFYWEDDQFQSTLVVLGWRSKSRISSVRLFHTNRPVSSFSINHSFKNFRVDEEDLGGHPFICLLNMDTFEPIPGRKNFTMNADYLYRLACIGSDEDFGKLGLPKKQLLKLRIGDNLSLMHGAALYGNMSVLKYLERVGAHNIKEKDYNSVIRYAIFGGKIDSVKFLTDLGHSSIRKLSEAQTPFLDAVHLGHVEIVDFLTDDSKCLTFKGEWGNAAFRSLVAGRPKIYQLLMDKIGDRDFKIETGVTDIEVINLFHPLQNNCSMGSLELVKALFELDEDLVKLINSKHKDFNAVRLAVRSGNPDLVQFLIDKGADLETTFGSNSETLLHFAANEGLPRIIRLLVDAGISINVKDGRGMTPLYTAVLAKKSSSVHELLALNADPNLKPQKGPAPVWMAVIQDERESIKSLIQYGANCELDQNLAMQVMDYALAFDIPEVVEISLDQCLTADFSFTGSVPGISWSTRLEGFGFRNSAKNFLGI